MRDDLQQELIRLRTQLDKTVVFVTHDIDEAFLLGDQVVILEKGGRIAQQGTPQEILSNPANDFVRDFVGADKGKRALHVEDTGTGQVLVDRDGRLVGVLDDEGRAAARSASAPTEAGAAHAPGAPAQGAGPA